MKKKRERAWEYFFDRVLCLKSGPWLLIGKGDTGWFAIAFPAVSTLEPRLNSEETSVVHPLRRYGKGKVFPCNRMEQERRNKRGRP